VPGFDARKLVIVAGMPRAGTTTLYHLLDRHPACFVPFRKETAYFSYNHYKGADWFTGLYRERRTDVPLLDISPQYFADLRSIERIRALAPDARVILSVRDPVAWIVSLFFQINKFEHKPSFAAFLDGYTIATPREPMHCALADGFVRRAIEAFRTAFGKNLLLYRFELFRDNPVRALQAIEHFAGIQPWFTDTTYAPVKVNATTQYHWRWLTWLLSRESVISAIDTLFPRPLIRRVRLAADSLTMPGGDRPGPTLAEADLQLAEARLGADRDWVNSLFADHPVLLGDGRPFEPPCPLRPAGAPVATTVEPETA